MSRKGTPYAYVLLTAMPPTKGHLQLIRFAETFAHVEVIINTQPDEPFVWERVTAIVKATRGMDVHVNHIHKELPQEPEGNEGFWDMWHGFLKSFGIQPGDYIVASEMYGQTLADIAGATFIPYDIDREIVPGRATRVRKDWVNNFPLILPEFQPELRRTITIFGAESVGKTTLTRGLAEGTAAWAVPEWARPYLEHVGPELSTEKMTNIWMGQRGIQDATQQLTDRPLIYQDTDLFSTIGYWDMWTDKFGKVPQKLLIDAVARKSDLYLIPRSNIPFEADPLRYGGDQREGTDEYWINLADTWGLNYRVLGETDRMLRIFEAHEHINEHIAETAGLIAYTRVGSDHG